MQDSFFGVICAVREKNDISKLIYIPYKKNLLLAIRTYYQVSAKFQSSLVLTNQTSHK